VRGAPADVSDRFSAAKPRSNNTRGFGYSGQRADIRQCVLPTAQQRPLLADSVEKVLFEVTNEIFQDR